MVGGYFPLFLAWQILLARECSVGERKCVIDEPETNSLSQPRLTITCPVELIASFTCASLSTFLPLLLVYISIGLAQTQS